MVPSIDKSPSSPSASEFVGTEVTLWMSFVRVRCACCVNGSQPPVPPLVPALIVFFVLVDKFARVLAHACLPAVFILRYCLAYILVPTLFLAASFLSLLFGVSGPQ